VTTVKTAISIDEDIFHEVQTMTKKMHISRSQFFSQAARCMIERKENAGLLRKIDEAYGAIRESEEEKAQRTSERKYALKRIRHRWK
jgi:metal-responsive CopG/Arc/MetJ family transcriptional regulator